MVMMMVLMDIYGDVVDRTFMRESRETRFGVARMTSVSPVSDLAQK